MKAEDCIKKNYNIPASITVKCRHDKKIVIFEQAREADVLDELKKGLFVQFNGGNTYASVCKTEELRKKYMETFQYLIDKQYLVETNRRSIIDLIPKWTLDEVFFELSKNCNLHCRHCYIPRDLTKKEMQLEQWKNLADECSSLGVGLIKLTGGEPMLTPYFWELISYIRDKKIRIRIYTNGSFLDYEMIKRLYKGGVKEIQISLDGGTAETHDSFRGTSGNFQKIMKALPILQKFEFPVILSFTLSDYNEHEVEAFLDIAYQYENVKVVISPYINYHQTCRKDNILDVSDQMVSNLKKCFRENAGKWSDKTRYYLSFSNRFIGYCGLGVYMLYIDSTRKVYFCPLLNQEENRVGDLKVQTLTEIWENSPLLSQYRQYTIADIEKCNICKNANSCRGGCRARAYMENNQLLSKDSISCKMY